MGDLHKHPVGLLQAEYLLDAFVETGLGPPARGLRTALKIPFRKLRSIEVLAEIATAAGAAIAHDLPKHRHRWEILLGDSADVIPTLLEDNRLGQRILWWLDAHYPDHYPEGPTPKGTDPVPLVREVRAIVEDGRHQDDVFLMDDWRIFGGHHFAAGVLPSNARGVFPAPPEHAGEILELLEPTHQVFLDHRDGGYLIGLPLGDDAARQAVTSHRLAATYKAV